MEYSKLFIIKAFFLSFSEEFIYLKNILSEDMITYILRRVNRT